MGDVPIRPEPEPETDFEAKLRDLRDRLDDGARVALTATHSGSLRRPILFIAVAVGLAGGGVLAIIGLVALIALALTDQVVAL